MQATRWWEEVVATAAEAFARAVARGDDEIAERWADVILRTEDQHKEDADA